MSWKYQSHSQKISQSIGIFNRLKSILPINYGILTWGYEPESILKLQKKAVRIITLAKYNAHTEPIFKKLSILKIQFVN